MAMKRIAEAGYDSGRNGFNSHPATRERLSHLAEISGNVARDSRNDSHNKSRNDTRKDSLDGIADILMGR